MATTSRYQNKFSIKICWNKDFPVLIINVLVLVTVLLVTVCVPKHAMLRTN